MVQPSQIGKKCIKMFLRVFTLGKIKFQRKKVILAPPHSPNKTVEKNTEVQDSVSHLLIYITKSSKRSVADLIFGR